MANYSIAHIEIPTESTGTSGQFYSNVFGWTIETNQMHNYVTFNSEGGPRGGFVKPSEPTYKPDRLLVYLTTDDIEGTLANVETHGGKIILPKLRFRTLDGGLSSPTQLGITSDFSWRHAIDRLTVSTCLSPGARQSSPKRDL